jgi:hypothetical protein
MEILEASYRIAEAKLDVAKNLGLIIAALVMACSYLRWHGWGVGILLAAVSYLVVTIPYRKRAETALEKFCRNGIDPD